MKISLNRALVQFTFAALSVAIPSLASSATKTAIDAKASTFEWKGSKVTGSTHNGTMSIKDGHVEMDGDKVVGGVVTVDMNSLTNLDLADKEYNTKLVTHLKSDDFFDVAKFPTAALTIKSGSLQKDGTYKLTGDLQIKNETHPVSFDATVGADQKSAETTLTVDRTKWNVRYGSGKFFKNLGDKMISDNMEFKVKLAFVGPIVSKDAPKEKAAAPKAKVKK